MKNREKFIVWLENRHPQNSGAVSSYTRALDWLSERYYNAGKIDKALIYDVKDKILLNDLYQEAREIQKNKNSYIFNNSATSYGLKGFYSASLRKLIDFVSEEN